LNTDLGAGARKVGAEHDSPGSLVVKLATGVLEAIFEQLNVATTAVAALLVLDLVLDDERLLAESNGLLEGSRDGVMCCLGLCNETKVTVDGRVDGGFLDAPLADVRPGLAARRGFLGCL